MDYENQRSRKRTLWISILPFEIPKGGSSMEIVYVGENASRPVNLNHYLYAFIKGVPESVCDLHARKLLKVPGFKEFTLWEAISQSVKNPTRVCIAREGGFGDVIMCIPMLRKLASLPNIELTLATDISCMDLFQDLPYIKNVISSKNVPYSSFDYHRNVNVMDSQNVSLEVQNTVHRIEILARCIGTTLEEDPFEAWKVELNLKEKHEEEATIFLSNSSYDPSKKLIAIQLRSNDDRRTLPKQLLEEIAKRLVELDYQVILLDHENKGWDGENIIRADGRGLSLGTICALIKKSDLLVGPDSGLVHAAACFETKVVVGTTVIPSRLRFSTYPNFIVLEPPEVANGTTGRSVEKMTPEWFLDSISWALRHDNFLCITRGDLTPLKELSE